MPTIAHVFDNTGVQQALGPMIARGGEGVIYPLVNRPEILVKCYHPEVLQKRGDCLKKKVTFMREMRQEMAQQPLAWPLISVYADGCRREWLGYAMYRRDGVPMQYLAHAILHEKRFPGLDRLQVTAYLISAVRALRRLHDAGIRIGDYNLQNFLCDPHSDSVSLIDCDSYQVRRDKQHYACPVGSPDMTPPEHQDQPFDQVVRTPESERFSLAIILFKCLMLGRHPYDVVGGSDPVSNIKNGNFPYGLGSRGMPKGPWYNIWSHMPFRLKSTFITTFTEGAKDPSKRPSLEEWEECLTLYQKELKKGWHEPQMRPATPKAKTYRGGNSVP